jgi:predicted ATPase
MWWLWPHLRRLWAATGAVIVGLVVTYLYSLSSKQALPDFRIISNFLRDYWPWFCGSLFALAMVSVFAERAHQQHEVRAPRPLQFGQRPLLARLVSSFRAMTRTAVSASPADRASFMVGREAEITRLGEWFAQVKAANRRVVFVSGEPGIGKTTLVRTFLGSITNDRTVRIGLGQCVEQYGAGEPYMPVLEALTRLCRESGGERLVAILHRLAPAWLAQMPSLVSTEDRLGLQSQAQGTTHQRMLREMAEALDAIAAESPLLLLLEDLHWSDPSTLELISVIARRTEPARLFFLCTYRPAEMLAGEHPLRAMKQELELHRYCEELPLKLLSEENIASYLAIRFAGNGTQKLTSLAPTIYERTEGNPLFMVNVADFLASQGSQLDTSKIEVPRSIRQMIEHNLQRLSLDDQMVLGAASVAGA